MYHATFVPQKTIRRMKNWKLEDICDTNTLQMIRIHNDQIRSVAQSCPTLCDPMNRSTPGLPVHHQLPEFTQTHVHRVSDAMKSPPNPLEKDKPKEWRARVSSVSFQRRTWKKPITSLAILEIETKTTPKEHEPCWLELQVYNYLVNNVAFFKETGCVHQSATAA